MLNFIKMQGTGNNYIYIDCLDKEIENYDFSILSKQISDVNYGIGSDGLIIISKSNIADAKMLIFNKDGSEGEMCGNGIRCVGKYIYDKYLKKDNILIETKSGVKRIMIEENNITVEMGYPIFNPKNIPVLLNDDIILNKEIIINNKKYYINCVSMGNPHTVIFVEDVEKIDIEQIGKLIQSNNIFPHSCNVEFVEVINKNKIKMRVYERGSGETYSCGTGACASVVMGVFNNLLSYNEEIEVNLKGGTLYITYNDEVYMKGPAEYICEGKYLVKKY